MKYKVGDKVRVREWDDMRKEFGLDSDGDIKCESCFTRAMKKFCGKIFTVEKVFDDFYDLKGGEGLLFSDDMLEPVSDKKIVITADGNTTLARLYEGGKVTKTAKAICSPDDEFDFIKGAELAFDRLNSEDKPNKKQPKYYSGKVVCVETNYSDYFTVGKIYECVDGVLDPNEGIKNYVLRGYKSLEHINKEVGAKFIELKE